MEDENSSNEKNEKLLQQIYAALGHAIRYDIVKYLGAFHRPVHYTELSEWLQIKPGSFYFHMKKLNGLVIQDLEKRFHLSSMGKLALTIIHSGEKTDKIPIFNEKKEILHQYYVPKRFSTKLFGEFIRRGAFSPKYEIFMFILVLFQIFLLEFSKLGIIPFFMDGNLYLNFFSCSFELLGSIIIIWISLELIMRLFSPIRGFSRELLIGIPLSISPLFIYPILVILSGIFPFLSNFIGIEAISIGIIFLLQIITAIFLIQLLQVIKSVNFERALIPVFIILYGFSILSFILSSLALL